MASAEDDLEEVGLTASEIAIVAANEKAGLVSQLGCHFCGMQFDIKKTRSLRAHIEEVHVLGDSGYMCGICCEEFTSRKAVENHMSTFHRAPKPLGCGICGETFRVRNLLLKHIDCHTKEQLANNKVGLCYCGECFEFFQSIMSLQAHVMNHRERAVFVCGACGLQSQHRHIMVKHLETHVISNLLTSGENSDNSENLSNFSDYWSQHVQTDASRVQTEDKAVDSPVKESVTDQLPNEVMENEEASYRCGVCHASFTNLNEALGHAGSHQDEEGTMEGIEFNVLMEESGDIASSAPGELVDSVDVISAKSEFFSSESETLNS